MVDFDFIKNETPFVSFFFTRLGVFLKSSGGRRPHVGLFVPRDRGAFRPILISLYPLLYQSLIAHQLEMIAIEYRESDVRSSVLETGLSSSGKSSIKDFEIVVSKPPIVFKTLLFFKTPIFFKSSFVFNPFSCSLCILPFRVETFKIYP